MRIGERVARISDQVRNADPTSGTQMPTEDELRNALASIPDDLNWEWAEPRLTPLFERADGGSIPGDPALHAVTPLGVAVGFGIEVGPTFARVTSSMAERWETSLEQIETAAFRHLAATVAGVGSNDIQHVVHHGHLVRCLPEPGGWASSAILAGTNELTRIFGPQDQVFTVPARNMLLSFDASAPNNVIADLTVLLEGSDPHPLMLDPFYLLDGELQWEGVSPGLDAASG